MLTFLLVVLLFAVACSLAAWEANRTHRYICDLDAGRNPTPPGKTFDWMYISFAVAVVVSVLGIALASLVKVPLIGGLMTLVHVGTCIAAAVGAFRTNALLQQIASGQDQRGSSSSLPILEIIFAPGAVAAGLLSAFVVMQPYPFVGGLMLVFLVLVLVLSVVSPLRLHTALQHRSERK